MHTVTTVHRASNSGHQAHAVARVEPSAAPTSSCDHTDSLLSARSFVAGFSFLLGRYVEVGERQGDGGALEASGQSPGDSPGGGGGGAGGG